MSRKKKDLQQSSASENQLTAKRQGAAAAEAENASDANNKNSANSDSEATKITQLVAQKNRSNLFLIKSYSFIDKVGAKRGVQTHKQSELTDFADLRALLLLQQTAGQTAKQPHDKKLAKAAKKLRKSKSAASRSNSHEKLGDLKHLLRKPALILGSDAGAATPAATPTLRTKSMPTSAEGAIKRESFIRQSFQSIRRSFGSHKKYAGSSSASTSSGASSTSSSCGEARTAYGHGRKCASLECDNEEIVIMVNGVSQSDVDNGAKKTLDELREEDEDNRKATAKRSTSSVISLAYTPLNSSMAPLQGHTEAQSVTCLNTIDKKSSPTQHKLQQQKRHYCQQQSVPGSGTITTGSSEYSSANSSVAESFSSLGNSKSESKSLKRSSTSLDPLVAAASSASIRSNSPSRKSVNSSGGTTAKNEQSSSTAAAASAAATPSEKEKKRKEVSSSRVKKFHRHFTQVSKDEKLINYYSCALVSDILLQGHLYITDQHFAFYSNVFGYVTKVVIPTSSVTKISKEKTAKIIPNAVGVATADERHVFSSFISREAAFRLMCSVCTPLAPIEILPKIRAEVEYSEELSIEDDSSCSISGNESPPQAPDAAGADNSGQTLLRRKVTGSSVSIPGGSEGNERHVRHSDIPTNAKSSNTSHAQHQDAGVRTSAPTTAHYNTNNNNSISPKHTNQNNSMSSMPKLGLPTTLLTTPTTGAVASAATNLTMIIAGTASSTSASSSPSPSSASSTTSAPTTVMIPPRSAAQAAATSFKALSKNALLRLKFPTEFHVVYLGVLLSIVLALFSGFLLYRILDIEAKTNSNRSPVVNWGSVNDDDIFADALRWQKELQTKSTEEAQSILNTNLQQIAKVRRSLETLSMLIHDRSSAASTSFATTTADTAADALNRDESD